MYHSIQITKTIASAKTSLGCPPLRRGFILIAFALAWVGLSLIPNAFGVTPPPDGGYPGYNTAEGQNALFGLTTGVQNTALGAYSLFSDATGSFNTAVGVNSLRGNTTGSQNTANGYSALFSNITGNNNTANGFQALYFNNGHYNSAYGFKALANNRLGQNNSAVGFQALYSETNGSNNTAVGPYALFRNTTGSGNTAVGSNALYEYNGGGSAESASSGNTAIGQAALFAGAGNYNTAVGYFAGNGAITGSGNVYLGAGVSATMSESNITRIRNVYSSVATVRQVYVDADNKLGTLASTRRVKDDIKPMDKASEAILALKPVTFRFKHEIDPTSASQFGLIAEEVEKVSPELVTRDADGQPESVRYEAVNAMLLNEFLKEHRKVEEQEAAITQLKKDFQATVAELNARLKEQDSKIEKVSAQLEVSRSMPQMVVND